MQLAELLVSCELLLNHGTNSSNQKGGRANTYSLSILLPVPPLQPLTPLNHFLQNTRCYKHTSAISKTKPSAQWVNAKGIAGTG